MKGTKVTKSKEYTVQKAGFINGAYEDQGATVNLTPNQALAFERSGHIALKAPKKSKAKPASQTLASGGKVTGGTPPAPAESETTGGRD